MDLISRKEELIRFLTDGIDEYHFTNGLQGRQLGFKSYNEFIEFQRQIINQYNENSIAMLETIRDTFLPITKVLDQPSMNIYKAAGFVFDVTGNIVYYDARL